MDLFLAISQGTGVSLATGLRSFLPPLLVCALASGDLGVDFEGTDYEFLESVPFLSVLLLLNVVGAFSERLTPRRSLELSLFLVSCVLGSLLFAGSLEEESYAALPGWLAGAACVALAYVTARMFLGRARSRLVARGDEGSAGFLKLFADGAACALRRLRSSSLQSPSSRSRSARGCCSSSGAAAAASTKGYASCARDLKKLVLFMIDSLKPEMLERAIAEDKAPMLAEIVRRGTQVPDGVSVFPSVTPAASASITTGRSVEAHGIPSINWYHRGEGRYVEYGSSWPATRTFGVLRTINDIVYNMNFEHLSRAHRLSSRRSTTPACAPHARHSSSSAGARVTSLPFRDGCAASRGPPSSTTLSTGRPSCSTESCSRRRDVECRPTLARPGTRDAYSGCVGEYLARYELYDFLLFSLPDNDHYSHRNGPNATVTSIAWADSNIARLAEGAGGVDQFFEKHAVIVMADHAQTTVKRGVRLADALSEWRVLSPGDPDPASAELAVSPGGRAAMVYLLGDEERRGRQIGEVLERVKAVEGVDLVAWKENGEACLWSSRGELRFAPGSQVRDRRGASWDVTGSLAALEGSVERR